MTPTETISPALINGAVRCVWPAGATLGEGALWSAREQALYWVDILGRQLHRLRPALGMQDSWSFDEEVSAVAERRDGRGLLLAMRHGFASFQPTTSALEPLCVAENGQPGNRFNDGKCDAQGRFWGATIDFACERPTGTFYRLSADGTCLPMHTGFVVYNGPTWTADGRTMLLNDTVKGRVQAFDYNAVAGRISRERTWLQLPAEDGVPDGMTTDADGRIWIAHWGGACVTCHDPLTTRELARIELPTSHITSCAFGGRDLQTLFITSARVGLSAEQLAAEPLAGGLFCVDMHCRGVAAAQFG